MSERMTRRGLLTAAGCALGAGLLPRGVRGAEDAAPAEPFGYCLNTSTIREQKLGIAAELELAAKVGYKGVEIWQNQIDEYVKAGGTPADLGKRARDLGLTIASTIAFYEWMVDDAARREKALEDAKRRMEEIAQMGSKHIAAPPTGNVKGIDLMVAAERYRTYLEIGVKIGVAPAVELWGFQSNLNRLGQVAFVAIEANHPAACMVPDVYHLHRGGSGLGGIRHLSGASIAIFHVNDYPAQPEREKLKDSDRVFPGDGAAPLKQLFQDLRAIGYRGMLSLELFNPNYYKRPAEEVLREGIEKTRAAVRASLG